MASTTTTIYGDVTSMRLPTDERMRADRLARDLGTSRSTLIRAALDALAARPDEEARLTVASFVASRKPDAAP